MTLIQVRPARSFKARFTAIDFEISCRLCIQGRTVGRSATPPSWRPRTPPRPAAPWNGSSGAEAERRRRSHEPLHVHGPAARLLCRHATRLSGKRAHVAQGSLRDMISRIPLHYHCSECGYPLRELGYSFLSCPLD